MDPMVEAALKKWPNVPHCYGWLALDARGDWYMRDDRIRAAGPFPRIKGSRIEHAKLRAFIECAAGRMGACKSHFRAALKLDPGFDLARAEAGHPMWGPAFREVRGETSAPPSR